MLRETGPNREDIEFKAPEEEESVQSQSEEIKTESTPGLTGKIRDWRNKEADRLGFDRRRSFLSQHVEKFREEGRKEVDAKEGESYLGAWWRKTFGEKPGSDSPESEEKNTDP